LNNAHLNSVTHSLLLEHSNAPIVTKFNCSRIDPTDRNGRAAAQSVGRPALIIIHNESVSAVGNGTTNRQYGDLGAKAGGGATVTREHDRMILRVGRCDICEHLVAAQVVTPDRRQERERSDCCPSHSHPAMNSGAP
jgi:hypothetical protein